ncbi:glycosyltransferase family 2 protein [Streptomyces sp. DSM 44917]|uniref:Glycosyltransferase family 2 protein n=1 Tax=Streptomyces boetiae TaxID=3075541 RepID=A0ABU2LF71_9ACTN|nr:glycosyltransferase family 2 protein [Streptomyces sp. DSM 44917]MDT0310235.1 glycosyltransferase family 2 protein [Streptomyces sp. DSM 44917]
MSVHSQRAAEHQAAHPEFPRHVVTAVLVSHDGERWLPDVLGGLLGQTRPVQDVIAADTGSADSSATLVGEALGAERVLHLARRTGFGTAVAEAARTAPKLTPDDLPYLKRPPAWDPVTRTWDTSTYDLPELPHGEPVHWLWLLHDDAAPEPDALAELLRQADASPSAAIVGAKHRGWYDRRQLLEAGVSIAPSGRRWTGLDRREQDQGQHDQVRPVLSVSTAGMLIRRDVFERLGGFDRRLPLMRDDVDLCWRAQAAGHRVLVAPAAVLRHAEAASRERRGIDCAGRLGGSPHRVDKAAAAYALLVNARGRALPWILFRLVLGTLLRILAYLVGKLPGRALDEAAGLLSTLLMPGRIAAARRRRRRTADPRTDPADLRPLFPPPLATLRTTVEQVFSNLSGRSEPASSGGGRHGAVESGPTDDEADSLEIEQFARLKRLARRPGPMLFLGLALASLLACRDLIGGGSLLGGSLLPAPAEAGALWDRYASTWQPVGTGGTETGPPYLGLLALLSTVLLGSTDLALTLLLAGCVPLAGASAYFSSRPLVASRLLRAWGSVAYAFLPAVTGAVAGGRIGTAVLAVLLPPLARTAVSAAGYAGQEGRGSWRATWACALLLTAGTAFTPAIWPLAVLLAACAVALPLADAATLARAKAARLGAVVLTPLVVLAPWSLSVLFSPGDFLAEPGLPFETAQAGPFELLNANPGGPGTPATWLLTGVLLAALGGLLRRERRTALTAAWITAGAALAFAVWADADTGRWAGPATLVGGLALLSAAVLGADGARFRVAAQSFGWRQPAAAAVAAAAVAGPLLAAAGWVLGGADGPLERGSAVQVPAFVAAEGTTRDQARTLVLAGGEGGDAPAGRLSYALVRGSGARLGDAELTGLVGENDGLSRTVGELTAGSGADQTVALAGFAVRYILVLEGTPAEVQRVLDTTPGLLRLSQEDGGALWRVDREISRVSVVPPAGEAAEGGASGETPEALPVPAGAVEVHADLPEGPEGRVLRLADAASSGWRATLDGGPLTPVTLDGWAQGFELPPGGGRLDVTYDTPLTHTLWVWLQGFALLVLCVLALPGRRGELDDDLPEEERPVPAAAPTGRRARREAAAASAGAAPAPSEVLADAYGTVPAQGVPAPPSPAPPGYAPGYAGQQADPSDYAGRQADVPDYAGQQVDAAGYAARQADAGEYAGGHADASEYGGGHTGVPDYAAQQADGPDYAGRHADAPDYAGQQADVPGYAGQQGDAGEYAGQQPYPEDYDYQQPYQPIPQQPPYGTWDDQPYDYPADYSSDHPADRGDGSSPR